MYIENKLIVIVEEKDGCVTDIYAYDSEHLRESKDKFVDIMRGAIGEAMLKDGIEITYDNIIDNILYYSSSDGSWAYYYNDITINSNN